MKRFLSTVLVAVATTVIYSQPYYFRHYQVENGLSNNTVFCSVQDKDGFMWFGTKDRLNRFDGYRFKAFETKRAGETNLTRDFVSALALDRQGTLWVGSQKGLFRFDAATERLLPFLDSLSNVSALHFDKAGMLWLIAANTLHRYNLATGRLTSFPQPLYFSATSVCETEDGAVWASTTDGYLQKFIPGSLRFQRYNLFERSPATPVHWIEKIASDGKGSLWVGTHSQGIKRFNPVTGSYRDVLAYNADKTAVYVRDILPVSKTEFWFATESGIYMLNDETGRFINLKKSYSDPYSLSDNAVYDLFKDREGGIWAGTYFGGLNYFPQQYYTFQKFFPGHTNGSISGNAVREICQDGEGNIWIGTEDAGLNKYNPVTNQIRHFGPTGKPGSLAASNVHGLLVVKNDLWVGTFQHGLDVLDVRTGAVRKHYNAGSGAYDLKSNFVVSLLQTSKGDILVGTDNGLFRYNRERDGFDAVEGLGRGDFVSCLTEAADGTVWGGSHSKGAFFLRPNEKPGWIHNEPSNPNSLPTDIVNAIYQDRPGTLWFATEGGGLCGLSPDKKRFTRYNTATGFASNFVFKVLQDEKGTLWVTTSKGLVNLNTATGKSRVYTRANGLLSNQFNYNSGFKDAAGNLFFGSVRGMVAFNPNNFHQSRVVPPVYVTGFQINGKEVEVGTDSGLLQQSITYTPQITLPHNQSSFSVDFAAISFTAPEMTEYSYWMEGLDKDWTQIKSNRKVYFTNLKPGTYTFRVKNADTGFEGQQEKQLVIRIRPPFWATGWAYALYVLTGGLLLYYLVRAYHIRQENRKEKEIYEAKFDFFVNIAHEIKTPLTLIKGPVENLSEMTTSLPAIKDDVAMMERNTARLVNLVNQVLDFRQTETKGFSLDFTDVNMNEQLQETYLMFEPLAKKRKLAYRIELPRRVVTTAADAETLNKIFSNLLSNAVKYAEKTVSVRLLTPTKPNADFCIEVRNDGFLVPADKQEKIFEPFFRLKETAARKGSGIGLALARSLAELHRGRLDMKVEGGLNVFTLRLPYLPTTRSRNDAAESAVQPS